MSGEQSTKLTLFMASFEGGGAERVMTLLANSFIARGYSVDFLVLFDRGPNRQRLDRAVNVIELTRPGDGRLKRKARAFMRLSRYYHQQQDLVVLSTLTSINILAAFTRLFARQPIRLFVREASTFEQLASLPRLASLIQTAAPKFLYPRQDGFIANSQSTLNGFVKAIPKLSDLAEVIYNPLDVDFIAGRAQSVPKSQHPSLVACGRLIPNKNFADIIKAMPRLRQQVPQLTLTILGEGPEIDNLLDLVKTLELENCVKFPGFVDDPYTYFAAAHVFVQTSRWEGFGYVLAEAMAAGTSVVAYEGIGAMGEILDNGRFGTLVPMDDRDKLVDAIMHSLQNPTPASVLEQAVARFRIEHISQQYTDALGL